MAAKKRVLASFDFDNDNKLKDSSALEMAVYRDTWGHGSDSYLQMVAESVGLARELLIQCGSIFIEVGVNSPEECVL